MQKQPGKTKPSGFVDNPHNYIKILSFEILEPKEVLYWVLVCLVYCVLWVYRRRSSRSVRAYFCKIFGLIICRDTISGQFWTITCNFNHPSSSFIVWGIKFITIFLTRCFVTRDENHYAALVIIIPWRALLLKLWWWSVFSTTQYTYPENDQKWSETI